MSTHRTAQETSSFGFGSKMLVLAAIAGLAGIAYFGFGNHPATPATAPEPTNLAEVIDASKATAAVPQDERTALYQSAIAKGKQQAATWPKTEQELLNSFWQAMIAKNLDEVLVMCPGSKKEDFGPYGFFVPQALVAIGKPEAYPTEKNVAIWPVKVNFQKFPNKTIKLALRRMDDGRLVVDGQYSIWW